MKLLVIYQFETFEGKKSTIKLCNIDYMEDLTPIVLKELENENWNVIKYITLEVNSFKLVRFDTYAFINKDGLSRPNALI